MVIPSPDNSGHDRVRAEESGAGSNPGEASLPAGNNRFPGRGPCVALVANLSRVSNAAAGNTGDELRLLDVPGLCRLACSATDGLPAVRRIDGLCRWHTPARGLPASRRDDRSL